MACGCSNPINHTSTPEPKIQICVRTKDYYIQLLIDIQPFNRHDWQSYVNSQINVYDNSCELFAQYIETNVIPYVYP
jgi:hypothetical protein